MARLRAQLPRGAKPAAASLLARLAADLPPRTTILSGAGISTESGLSDYRSPGKPPARSPTSHHDFVTSARTRQTYWARSFVGYPLLSSARPNAAHAAIAALAAHPLRHHVTQNVDGLAPALALHGTVHRVACRACAATEPRADFQRRLRAANPRCVVSASVIRPDGDADLSEHLLDAFNVPRCRVCHQDTLIPDLVFHGGTVPRHVTERATAIVDNSDALLVVGSTVTPYSAYRLVKRAATNGAYVACINFGPTRADHLYNLKVEALVGHAMATLANRMLGNFEAPAAADGQGGCLQL